MTPVIGRLFDSGAVADTTNPLESLPGDDNRRLEEGAKLTEFADWISETEELLLLLLLKASPLWGRREKAGEALRSIFSAPEKMADESLNDERENQLERARESQTEWFRRLMEWREST